MKAYGYVRASTNEQELTLTAQQDLIKKEFEHRLADKYEWGGFFIDKGVSAAIPLRQRPYGHHLDKQLEGLDCVIFTKLDRGFRNVKDLLETLEHWTARGIKVIILDLNIDTTTPAGKLTITIMGATAEFDRACIRQRVLDVNARRRAEGLPFGGAQPHGFKAVGPTGRKKLVRCDYSREVIGQLTEWHRRGWTIDQLWQYLVAHQIKRANGKEYSRTSMYRAIKEELKLQLLEAEEAKKKKEKP